VTESEAWALAEDGLERRDNTQALVACDALQECGRETEASTLRWYLRKGMALFYLTKTDWSLDRWQLFDGDPYEDKTTCLVSHCTSFKQAVGYLVEERKALLEVLSD